MRDAMNKQLAWPEQIIGFLLVLEIIGLLFLGLTSQTVGSAEQFSAIPSLWRVPVFTLVPIWVVARMIDFLFAGPARRKGAFIVRPL